MDKKYKLDNIVDASRLQSQNQARHSDQKSLIEEKNIVNHLKEKLKKHNRFYYWISIIFAQAYYNNHYLKKILSRHNLQELVVVNCGSGNKVFDKNIINIDLCDYPNVDIVADISQLPIKDDKVDLIINESILEHVERPYQILAEAYRVLKSGGLAVFVVPFMFTFHASPHDYNRWTHQGLKSIFSQTGFKDIKVKVISGPASAFLGSLLDLLANLLSFNLKPLYYLWFIFFSLWLWPIKFLDIFLNNYKTAKFSASVFLVEATK